MSQSIKDKFDSWDRLMESASKEDTNLSSLLDIKLKYMDNRSIDELHSRNLTIHLKDDDDCGGKLLYMVKLFYKHLKEDTEELYIGFRKSSQTIINQFREYLTSFECDDNIEFGGEEPEFICVKIFSNKNTEIIYEVEKAKVLKLIRIYIGLVIITLNTTNEYNS